MLSTMIDHAFLMEEDRHNNLHPLSDIGIALGDLEHPRTRALMRIIPYLSSKLIDKVLLATRELDDIFNKSVILKHIVLHVQQADPNGLYVIWNEALHVFASLTRADLFDYLESILPLLFTLGGLEGLQELNDMIAELP
ncbi:hypothetical protein [Ktedonobacter racemifer]|uniref:Uncharacterized protein n=1 Tax=Ktedonobacter racemifer DSM 44963 TaxID=485913 RepID=D6TX27_KTERA|nr:hypothetical protein [Ktedonobacter racemifer]EFH84760.1 hypothetical protein Krac_5865 [Ktedonobacter racemifer DSM 44963]